jgi:hypothetical protein
VSAQPEPAALRARLEASRAALLEAIARLTEQDFASQIDGGQSVVGLLASLATAERAAVAEARGVAPPTGDRSGSALAPQAIHDLAGARFETLRALAAIEAATAPGDAAIEAISAVAAREEAAAERIRSKFAGN